MDTYYFPLWKWKLISIFVLMSTYQRRPLDQQHNKDIKKKAYTIGYTSLLGVLLILWFIGSGSPFSGDLSEKRISTEPNQTITVRILRLVSVWIFVSKASTYSSVYWGSFARKRWQVWVCGNVLWEHHRCRHVELHEISLLYHSLCSLGWTHLSCAS